MFAERSPAVEDGIQLDAHDYRTYVLRNDQHGAESRITMGENKRYGSDLTESAINDALIRPKPISLSEREVGGDITSAETPVPVAAWVRFPESAVRVNGRAVAWTKRAVWVEFSVRDGSTTRAWVWASAVDRR